MKTARYLIRFDDVCPTMNWTNWNKVERILVEQRIKPIIAVIPNNKDIGLMANKPNRSFWHKVRLWQKKEWSIAIHGYEHIYLTQNSGLLGLNNRSEFAGLPYSVQRDKILKALSIFRDNGVEPDLWIAPAHSFDRTTIAILLENGINIINDGFFLRPVILENIVWIPQQLWKFRNFPFGIWTVCFHINSLSDRDIEVFSDSISRYRSKIISVRDVMGSHKLSKMTLVDRLFAIAWLKLLRFRRYSHLWFQN